MKKFTLAIAALLITALYASADIKKNVTLSNADSVKIVKFQDICEFTFELTKIRKNGTAQVAVSIKNLNYEKGLYIFNEPFNEKQLKKKPYKIRFGKQIPGPKGSRYVRNQKDINQLVALKALYSTRNIARLEVFDEVPTQVTFPIYLVEFKNPNDETKKKTIVQTEDLIVNFDVYLDTPREYLELKLRVDELKAAVDTLNLCDNPKHEPSFEEQKAVYDKRVNGLLAEYAQIKRLNDWVFSSSERGRMMERTAIYRKYDALHTTILETQKKLEHIPTKDCGAHEEKIVVAPPVTTGHHCAQCSSNLTQLISKLENIYMKIHNSDDPQAIRQQYADEVRQIEACAKRRSEYGKYQRKIEKFIERINEK